MKNIIPIILFITTALLTLTNAQLQKGKLMLGGNMMSSNFALNKGGNFNISMDMKSALFLADNFALGGKKTVGFNGSKSTKMISNYDFGLLGRFYFNKEKSQDLSQCGKLFLESSLGIEGIRNGQEEKSTSEFNMGLGTGYSYFLSPYAAVEMLILYNRSIGYKNTSSFSVIGLSIGFQAYLPSSTIKQLFKRKSKKETDYRE
ncbi:MULTISPECIES: hypothetical protein [Elizabethkingia]|uniref:Outer membrane protein beta-barrel domain-containing protein n=1 Tax=Elizabethkingia ursingii TaxID=1756150 RepID=A0AAJ3NEV8_9FLAO|nr:MULTISPECIES: hypothetical protein [Elizabethkingia]AQW92903.1 hypothetical protein BBD30_01180 [Elizabethkingia anophelis]AQX09807.1 hypothetical protein BBD34_14690 [Elizabethkingia ursingii]OPB60822.1 hypothetical protein BAS07_17565 [Elizabethkingia anophelis]OPB78940.1 hypothetical protein BAY32_18965 [Elizabethkingia ursingii]OPB91628.1 hypothetical protein BB021_17095 [Elizabethkingia ursingii]